MMPRKLLWVDGLGGAIAGVAMLLASNWLGEWYQLPINLLLLNGAANLTYASYSLSLAMRTRRPKALILLLIAANLMWAMLCLRWVFVYAGTASLLGLAHLVGEVLFVGGLASLEWRWREQLQTA